MGQARWQKSERSAVAVDNGRAHRTRVLARWAGVALLLHGFAHAGAGLDAVRSAEFFLILNSSALGNALWGTALLLYTASGFGLLGVIGLRRLWRTCAIGGTIASLAFIVGYQRFELAVGGLLSVLVWLLLMHYDVNDPLPEDQHKIGPIWTWLGNAVALSFLLYLMVVIGARPFHQRWGATDAEVAGPLRNDPMPVRASAVHAITIDQPPEKVWPWIAQIGQDRAGFYSFEVLENAFGADIHNSWQLHPEWQSRAEGEILRAVPDGYLGFPPEKQGWEILHWQPNQALVLKGWGSFILQPRGPDKTRFVIRSHAGKPIMGGFADLIFWEPAHYIMERRMMENIKALAEGRVDGTGKPVL